MTRRFGRRPAGIALLGIALSAAPLLGAATKIWVVDSAADFSLGEARGVSVSADGALVLSGEWKRVEGWSEASLFAAAVEKDGSTVLATGDSGRIIRVSPAGKVETVATLTEKEVTAIAVGGDGALYVAAAPGGKIYRVAGGTASLYYAPQAKYVWALAFAGNTLWVGTGLPGEIHKVTAAGKGERVHATSDAHVRSLHVDTQGRVWAGTSGSGLVLRVEASGKVVTVYDSSRSEITSIVAGAGGRTWVAASSGDTSGGGGEPISVLAVAPTLSGKKPETVPGEEAKDKADVSVSVSTGRVAPSPGGSGRYSSEVLVLQDGEAPRTAWTSSEEMVFALLPSSDGRDVLAATGPRGRLYRVAVDSSSLERTQDEKQVTVLVDGAIGTNAGAALYRRQAGLRQGEYVSAVKDTGRTSRFGAFRFEGETPAGGKVEFAFRSGEAAAPDSTWSPWSAFAPGGPMVNAPPGRYLQWKLRMSGAEGPPRVRRVEASYRNRNSAPTVDSLVALAPNEVYARSSSSGQNVFETTAPDEKGIFTSLEEPKVEGNPRRLLRKGYRTITWKASDPDGDPLTYELEVRPTGSDRFLTLRKALKEIFYSFDTTSLPDGDYVFRLTASDGEVNPEDRKSASRESSPIRIDNTPPVIRKLASAPGTFEFEAVDALSPILEAEYSVDAKEWIRVEPNDGLSDSSTEQYRIRLDPKARGSFLLIRVTDAGRNVAASSFSSRSPSFGLIIQGNVKRLCAALLLGVLSCRGEGPPAAARPPATPRPTAIPPPVLGYIDESGNGTPVDSPVLRRRLIGDPSTLNAVMQTGLPEQQVLQYVSRNLLDFDTRMRLVPGLAERYDVSGDGRTFTFQLRPEAVWEDGSPVTASDAVFTLKKIVDPDTPAPVIKPLFPGLESVEALGEKGFRVRFRKAGANQAMAFVLPLLPEKRFAKRRFLKAPDNRRPFSNGPYRFVSWKPQESIELVRNEAYWGPRPHFERIIFKILPDNSTAWRALVEDSLDETWIDQSLKEKSAGDPAFAACCRLVEYYDLDFNYVALNNRSPLFSDVRVRRALTMLLDRAAIVRSLYHGSARIISGPWAPHSPAYDASVTPLPYDPEAARQLLDEAGWRDSNGNGTRDKDGREFAFDLLVSSGSLIGSQIDEILAGAAKKAGIEVRVRSLEWAAYVDRLDRGDFEAASGAWSASDPNPDLFSLWHSSQVPPHGANSAFFHNAEADRLIEAAASEMDEKRRVAIYSQLHTLLRDEAPAIWVVNASKKYALRKSVLGLTTSPLGLFGTWPGPLGWWMAPAP